MESHKLLKDQLELLNLKAISNEFAARARQFRKSRLDYIDYLGELVTLQVEDKLERSSNYKLRQARFPALKTIEQFDFEFSRSISKPEIMALTHLEFMEKAQNIVMIGPPGTGKTHLATAIGIRACFAGKTTLFASAIDLMDQIGQARLNNSLPKLVTRLARIPLLIIDELGYLPIHQQDANIFFRIVSQRYEKHPVIITTNKPFADWGSVFGDDILATAILDRLLHHSRIFKMTGASYRMKDKLIDQEDKQNSETEYHSLNDD